MLARDPAFDVVGEASNGRLALDLARDLEPDVITLDLHMPGWHGLETLERILAEISTSVVILSSYAQEGADLTLRALTGGAVDFIDKSRVSTMALYDLERELVMKLKAAASSRSMAALPNASSGERVDRPRADLFVLGASTGGPRALQSILSRLPADFPARVLVIQHIPAGFTRALAERLDETCQLPVCELAPGDSLAAGRVHVAPGGTDLTIDGRGADVRIVLHDKDKQRGGTSPSIDRALDSAAAHYGAGLCAVILTGMGDDGVVGVGAVRERGGVVIAEAPSSCIVYGMPRAVSEAGLASAVAPLGEIPGLMLALARDREGA